MRQQAGSHDTALNRILKAVLDNPFVARHVASREVNSRIHSPAVLASVRVNSLLAGADGNPLDRASWTIGAMSPMAVRDYYETLQVTPDAEPEVVAAAYKRLAFKYHPDRNKDSAADGRMRDLNEAYETLGDPQRRQQYDAQRNAEQTLQQIGPHVHGLLDQGQSPDDVIENLVQMGIDLETSSRIVGAVVEIRRTSAPTASVPSNSPSPSPSWLSSNWGWVVLAVVVIGYLYNRGGGKGDLGERLAFGKGEVYFTSGVEKGEAQKLGDLLVREKYSTDRPGTVQVRLQDRRYEVQCVVRAGVEADPEIAKFFRIVSWRMRPAR